MARRAVVYMRKSSSDSDENHQKYSLERQIADIETYLNNLTQITTNDPDQRIVWNKDYGVDWFYEDASAKLPAETQRSGKPVRPKFLAMLKSIHKGRFDLLITTDLSRLSRNAVDTGKVVQLLEPTQIRNQESLPLQQICVLDKAFKSTPTDKFTLSLFMSVAKFENDQRAKNTSSGLRRKRAAGGTGGKAPIGYINCGVDKNNKWVEADERTFDHCRLLWDMLLSGNYSFAEIYEKKNQLKIQHYFKKKWRLISDSQLRTMFSNRYYTGRVPKDTKADGEWLAGKHPAMVTTAEFETAQMKLQSMGRTHAKLDSTTTAGDLIAFVATSAQYTYTQANHKTRPAALSYEERTRYYCPCDYRFFDNNQPTECRRCHRRFDETTKITVDRRFTPITNKTINGKIVHGKTAKGRSFTLDSIVKRLEKELSKLVITDAFFELCKKRLLTLWLNDEKQYKTQLNTLLDQEKKLATEVGTLRRHLFDDTLPAKRRSDAQKALEIVEAEIIRIADQKISMSDTLEERFEMAWVRLQTLRDAKTLLSEDVQFEPKKQLLLSLCSNLKIDKNFLEIEWRSPFDSLASQYLDSNKKTGQKTSSECANIVGSRENLIMRTLLVLPTDRMQRPLPSSGYTSWKDERNRQEHNPKGA